MRVAGGQALELLLSTEGSFVRDILLDELAKGADASWRLALDSAVSSARSSLLALLGVRVCQCPVCCELASYKDAPPACDCRRCALVLHPAGRWLRRKEELCCLFETL